MTELNMHPTQSFVRINATYTNRIPSGGVSYAPFRHFVLLKKYIVYGQGPIACILSFFLFLKFNRSTLNIYGNFFFHLPRSLPKFLTRLVQIQTSF